MALYLAIEHYAASVLFKSVLFSSVFTNFNNVIIMTTLLVTDWVLLSK